MKLRTVAQAVVLACMATSVTAAEITCTIHAKFLCRAEGCTAIQVGTAFNKFDLETRNYSRCDSKGCDAYPGEFVESGAFINILFPDRSLMAKLSTSDGHFLKVVTIVMDTLVSYGICWR